MAALREAHNARAAAVFFVAPDQVAHCLKAPQQLVHCLFAHACPLRQLSRTYAVRSWVLQNGDVRQAQIVKPSRVKLMDDSVVDSLRWNAQHCPNEQILWFEC
jgi:hypothetical protein